MNHIWSGIKDGDLIVMAGGHKTAMFTGFKLERLSGGRLQLVHVWDEVEVCKVFSSIADASKTLQDDAGFTIECARVEPIVEISNTNH